jgi:hypothetical protein
MAYRQEMKREGVEELEALDDVVDMDTGILAEETTVEQEMVKAVDDLESTDKAILERLGGPLTAQQKKQLRDLSRLYDSLQGPEDALDQSNYSRPFPPVQQRRRSL